VFQCTGLNDEDRYFMKACPAQAGDFLEFFAEIDLLCALSTCPGGDLSVPLWGPDARDPLEVRRPLGVVVYPPGAGAAGRLGLPTDGRPRQPRRHADAAMRQLSTASRGHEWRCSS
jgi:hypothetical protein